MKALGTLTVLMLLMFSLLAADEVTLTNGDVIHGTFQGLTDCNLSLTTDSMGKVSIDRCHVAAVQFDEAMQVCLADGETVEGVLELGNEPGEVVVSGDNECHLWVLSDICAIALPCDPCMQDVWSTCWSGKVAGELTFLAGNSDKENVEIEGKGYRETKRCDELWSKWTFTGKFRFEEKADKVTIEKLETSVKRERFLTKYWSWFIDEDIKYDRRAALDLRLETTVALGHFLWRSDCHSLQLHGGASIIDAYYSKGKRNEHSQALSTGWHWFYQPFKRLKIDHDLEYSPEIPTPKHYWVETDLMLTVPITDCWEVSFEHDYEYHSFPPTGKAKWDRTYELKAWYKF